MKITHCKLKKEVQKEPLRSFVPEVTARSAADILGIHPDSAALFYRKIRTVANHRLALAADEVCGLFFFFFFTPCRQKENHAGRYCLCR
ncbi:IS1016 transposase [Neisseria gonorrhoeae]|nr:IS1016 transposase [Neisseria gonorrhoeae]